MKKLIFILSVFAIAISSCSKSHKEILKTVPADSTIVAIVDMESLASKIGAEGRKELQQILDDNYTHDAMDYLFSEDSDVDFSAPLVVFQRGGSSFASFYVKDAGHFRQAMEKAENCRFSKAGGVEASDNNRVFIKGKQVWLTGSYPEVTAADIEGFASLDEKGSVLSLPCADMLDEGGNDAVAIFNVARLYSDYYLDMQSKLMVNMVFDDLAFVVSQINFNNGKVESETLFLNDSGDTAAFALPLSTLDVSDLKAFDGKGNMFGAFSLNSKLVNDLISQFGKMNFLPAPVMEFARQLDGPVAFALRQDSAYHVEPQMAVMLTFSSSDAAEMASSFLAQQFKSESDMQDANVYAEGKSVRLFSGQQSGKSFGSYADSFRNTAAGVVISSDFYENLGDREVKNYLKDISIMLVPEGKGAKIVAELATVGEGNSLVSILKMANYYSQKRQYEASECYEYMFEQDGEPDYAFDENIEAVDAEYIDW